jgi:hypothetical protein
MIRKQTYLVGAAIAVSFVLCLTYAYNARGTSFDYYGELVGMQYLPGMKLLIL